jgi:primase-polymerase (primpol)-like protein
MKREIEPRQQAVDEIHAEVFAERVARRQLNGAAHSLIQPNNLDDETLLAKARGAKNGRRFTALYDQGAWQAESYPSQSEADAALCAHLMFWTGNDRARTDRLFRSSALMRDEWAAREDLRERTLNLATCANAYQPQITKSKLYMNNSQTNGIILPQTANSRRRLNPRPLT